MVARRLLELHLGFDEAHAWGGMQLASWHRLLGGELLWLCIGNRRRHGSLLAESLGAGAMPLCRQALSDKNHNSILCLLECLSTKIIVQKQWFNDILRVFSKLRFLAIPRLLTIAKRPISGKSNTVKMA